MVATYKGARVHLPGTKEPTQFDEICRVFLKTTIGEKIVVAAQYAADHARFHDPKYRLEVIGQIKAACQEQLDSIKGHWPDLSKLYEAGVIKNVFHYEQEKPEDEVTIHDFSVNRLVERVMKGYHAGSGLCKKFEEYTDSHGDYHFVWGEDLDHALDRFKRICSEKAKIISETASLFQSK